MMHKSHEEVRKELVDKLGEEFGAILHDLTREFVNLKIIWRFYRSFYGTNPERIDLLNEISRIFFYTLEKTMFEAVLLGICRLSDPVETGRGKGAKQNLTVRRLSKFLNEENREDWENLLKDIDDQISFAKDWRNQKIAHSSYDLIQGQAQLEEASREKVERALASIANALNYIQITCLNSDMLYDALLPLEDEVRVLEKLYDGLEVEKKDLEALNEALERGDIDSYPEPKLKPDWLIKRP